MASSLYTGPKRASRLLLLLMGVNLFIAFWVVFIWAGIAAVIAEPISWATWIPLSATTQPDLLDYPYVALWAMPMAGILFAWLAINVGSPRWAYFWAGAPMVYLAMILGYFHFVPVEFH